MNRQCVRSTWLWLLLSILLLGSALGETEGNVSNSPLFAELLAQDLLPKNKLIEVFGALEVMPLDQFNEEMSQFSTMVRQQKRHELTLQFANQLATADFSDWQQEKLNYLYMILSYDLMFFAEFQVAFDLLSSHLDRVQAWSANETFGLTSKANLLHIYGQLLVRKQRVSEALPFFYSAETIFKRLDKHHPSIFTIQVIVGEAFLEAEHYQSALEYLQKAIAIFPEQRLDARSYVAGLLAKTYLKLDRFQDAHRAIHEYLDNPVDPREDYFLFFSLIHLQVLQAIQEYEEYSVLANETYQLAQKIGNEDYLNEARLHLGFEQLRTGKLDAAINLLNQAINGSSDIRNHVLLDGYLWLVDAYKRTGLIQEALQSYEEYVTLYKQQQKRLNQRAIAEISAQYDVEKAKVQAQTAQLQLSLQQEQEKRTKLVLFFLLSLVLLLITTTWLISLALLNLRRKNSVLDEISTKDPLTKIGNRLALSRDTQDNVPACVVLADIDYLKFYNDKFGHDAGDKLIQTFVQQLQLKLEEYSAQLYRIGGDEFVITSDTDIRQSLAAIFEDIEQELKKTGFSMAGVSYGAACIAEAHYFSKQLSLADLRMYEAKARKKQRDNHADLSTDNPHS
ncbi:tetratricopeptide repeat-containing diguanylate cyclase [Reinekea sp. G2M2-21]|uniref:tetratricopeptide repeat-containing diguanylate cyclase n=1 Tax=Reinekea sp. G2M2-21 TaxID=2788942 RepID=UPI0018AAC640|nr:tetratricopeptide repeat-containing diguanylate cyclase [Reinekea sp. G2M2-21]